MATPDAHDPTDVARYSDMYSALLQYGQGGPRDAAGRLPPRDRAFRNALRSVLIDIDNERDAATRHVRITAGYQWFVKHRPRPRPPHPEWAAAMTASLSVPQLLESDPGQQQPSAGDPQPHAEGQLAAGHLSRSASSTSSAAEADPAAERPGDPQPAHQRHHWWWHHRSSEAATAADARPRAGACRAPSPHVTLAAAERAAHANLCGAFNSWLAISPSADAPCSAAASPAGAGSSDNRGGADPAAAYLASRQRWVDAHRQQAAIEAGVGQHMAGYASSRARAEGETLRRQEARLLGSPSRQLAGQAGGAHPGLRPRSGATAAAAAAQPAEALPAATRVLLHLDSQHKAPQLSAYHHPQAMQLVQPTRWKETKAQLQQESLQEATAVGTKLASSGVACDAAAVSRALVVLPDQPFLTCIGSLPRPGGGLLSVPGSGPEDKSSSSSRASKKKRKAAKKG